MCNVLYTDYTSIKLFKNKYRIEALKGLLPCTIVSPPWAEALAGKEPSVGAPFEGTAGLTAPAQ